MNLTLHRTSTLKPSSMVITGSKSESNRLLLLQALFPPMEINNLSDADDTKVMLAALNSGEDIIDIHHAGTAMRFLTAFFAIQNGREVILTGSSRMKERPIKLLVDALLELGADISYLETEGFPPLKIKGTVISKKTVTIKAGVSSQYVSALLLIAPKLQNGLELTLEGDVTSIPYINMTLGLLHRIGVETSFVDHKISIQPHTTSLTPHTTHFTPPTSHHPPQTLTVESDWSSASYFYSMVALSEMGTKIQLSSYRKNSLQGDAILVELYKAFGVDTQFVNDAIVLQKTREHNPQLSVIDLQASPDIAQTIAVTCFGLGMGCHLTGLHTLKIKETDRLAALKTELEKLGAEVMIQDDSLILKPAASINKGVTVATYNDHRMAMAFAPLALKTTLRIEDAMVVSKSYPTFWNDLKTLGFKITE